MACLPNPYKLSILSPGQTIATCQRNMSQHCWAQHVACVWPPFSDMLGVVGSNLTIFKFEPTTSNMSQHIATRWPNARNMMLRSTMLQHVALACCDRLAGALGDIWRATILLLSSSKYLYSWLRLSNSPCNFDTFQRERLVAKLQHRTEAQGNTARIKTNTSLQGKPCAFDKSGIPGFF